MRTAYTAPLPPPDVLGEDEELVAGRRPVEEAFVARREAHRLLVVPQRRQALEKLVLHATSLRIPIVELEGGSLTALAGFDGHQGVALVVAPRQFATVDDILARARQRGEAPFVLALDSLEDPQNVGTLLRSAEAAGVHGILFPTRRQAPLSPAAVKASAGAVEHLLLCPVDDLAAALADLRSHGLRVAGAEADAPLTARQSDLRGPLTIVVGSEGQGLGPAIRRRCDVFMRIPMRGAIGSLNAAVAGSILLFEAVAQRDPDGRTTPLVSVTPDATDGPEDAVAPADESVIEPESGAVEPKAKSRGRSQKPGASARATGGTADPKPNRAKAAKQVTAKPSTAKAKPAAAKATVAKPAAAKPAKPAKPATTTKPAAAKATSAAPVKAPKPKTEKASTPKTEKASTPKTEKASATPADDLEASDADDLLPGGPAIAPDTAAAPAKRKRSTTKGGHA